MNNTSKRGKKKLIITAVMVSLGLFFNVWAVSLIYAFETPTQYETKSLLAEGNLDEAPALLSSSALYSTVADSVYEVDKAADFTIDQDKIKKGQIFHLCKNYKGTITIEKDISKVTIEGYDANIQHNDTCITLESGRTSPIVLTIKNLNIKAPSGKDGIDFGGAENVDNKLYLVGSSIVKGDNAGIHVPDGVKLIIDKPEGMDNDGTKLDVTSCSSGAGIGGGNSGTGGTIEINGGTITATSTDGAGIGGAGGNIKISGGTVTAASTDGAGIGGGNSGTGGTIEINGGTITASSTYGAGIGGGNGSLVGDIKISGGTVIATSTAGAGIGCGLNGHEGNVIISGTPTVIATTKNNDAEHIGKGGGTGKINSLMDIFNTNLAYLRFQTDINAEIIISADGIDTKYLTNNVGLAGAFVSRDLAEVTYTVSKEGYGAVKGTQQMTSGKTNYDISVNMQEDSKCPEIASVNPTTLKGGTPIHVEINESNNCGLYGILYLVQKPKTNYTTAAELEGISLSKGKKIPLSENQSETDMRTDNMEDAVYQIYAVDSAENVSLPSQDITIDSSSQIPSIPDMSAASDTGASDKDNITNNTSPTFTGTAETGSTVILKSDKDGEIGRSTADIKGEWSITSNELSEGKHNITAKAQDKVGNISTSSASLLITIDTTVPRVNSLQTKSIALTSLEFNFTGTDFQGLDHFKLFDNRGQKEVPASTNAYTLTNLTPNTKYTLKVQGVDISGNESKLKEISAYTLAENPCSVLTKSTTQNTVIFEITNTSQGESPEHRLEIKLRDTGINGENKGLSEWSKETTRTIKGLSPSTEYELWIQTRNSADAENKKYKVVDSVITKATPTSNDDDNGNNNNSNSNSTPSAATINEVDKFLEDILDENGTARIDVAGRGDNTLTIPADVMQKLIHEEIPLTVQDNGIKLNFLPNALTIAELNKVSAQGANFELIIEEPNEEKKQEILQNTPAGEVTGLFEIGGRIFDLSARIVDENGITTEISQLNDKVDISVDLSELNLSQEDIAHLTAIRYKKDKEGSIIPVEVGGTYNPKTKAFIFSTDRLSPYKELQSGEHTTMSLTIGSPVAVINGETVANGGAPILVNNRTMVPLRLIGESLGAKVSWDEETKTVTIQLDNRRLELVIGQTNDEMDIPAQTINGRTMVPLRYISEQLGAKVTWTPETQTIEITK